MGPDFNMAEVSKLTVESLESTKFGKYRVLIYPSPKHSLPPPKHWGAGGQECFGQADRVLINFRVGTQCLASLIP